MVLPCPGCLCSIGGRGKGLSSRPPCLQPPLFLRKVSQLLNPASWETLGIVRVSASPITRSPLVLLLVPVVEEPRGGGFR